jgi:hypothetical protein
MWRFYLAATIIVAVFIYVVTLRKAEPPDLRISARAHGTPSAARSQGSEGKGGGAVIGDAPWALSALPDCARQHAETRGIPAIIATNVPANATPVEGDFTAGPCTIRVRTDGIYVTRGEDRMRIPPPVKLFRVGQRYYLLRQVGTTAELRVYTLEPGH